MLKAGKALKVSIYVSEGSKHHGVPMYSSILDFLFYRGVSGATVVKGIAGFGADHHMHSASIVEISDHLPLKIEFIESPEKVNEILGKLEEMAGTGMIEVQETTIAKPAQVSKPKKATPPAHMKMEGKAKMMRIYIGEADRWKDKPLYQALVEAMRANDIAGVTVYRGILGYGAHRRMHKDKPLHLSHDCSIMLSAVDTEEKLRPFCPLVEQMVEEGLVVLSDVDIIKYSYRALDVDHAGVAGGNAQRERRLAHERTISSTDASHSFWRGRQVAGQTLHEAIVAKCMELGMAGATVYRGIEGYGASTRIHHASHWKFSKDAPIMLSIIDKEEQIDKLIPHLDAMVEEGLIAMSRVDVIRYSRDSGRCRTNRQEERNESSSQEFAR